MRLTGSKILWLFWTEIKSGSRLSLCRSKSAVVNPRKCKVCKNLIYKTKALHIKLFAKSKICLWWTRQEKFCFNWLMSQCCCILTHLFLVRILLSCTMFLYSHFCCINVHVVRLSSFNYLIHLQQSNMIQYNNSALNSTFMKFLMFYFLLTLSTLCLW